MRQLGLKPQVRVIASHRIDTTRLRLRPPSAADATEIARLVGNVRVAHWLVRVPVPYRLEHARSWIDRSLDERAAGIGWPFLMERREDRALIGSIDLSIEDDRSSGALGYWIAESLWGQGYAAEAGAAMLQFAFDIIGLDEVTANVLPENSRSVRVLEKIGLHHLGRREEETLERGKVDTEFFALRRTTWRGDR